MCDINSFHLTPKSHVQALSKVKVPVCYNFPHKPKKFYINWYSVSVMNEWIHVFSIFQK